MFLNPLILCFQDCEITPAGLDIAGCVLDPTIGGEDQFQRIIYFSREIWETAATFCSFCTDMKCAKHCILIYN